MGAIDSQSVKNGMFVSDYTGIDGNKNVNGRERHILIDSLGLPIAISVTSANINDGNESKNLIQKIKNVTSRLTLIRADDTYKGSFVDEAKVLGYDVEFRQKP
jgi:putative transposase